MNRFATHTALLLAALFSQFMACASFRGEAAEQHTRTALDTIGAVVDPAYEAAMLGCETRTKELTAELRAGGFKPAYADEAATLTKRCDKTMEAFETIRKLHEQAVSALDGGALEKAQSLYAKLLLAWGALKGGAS